MIMMSQYFPFLEDDNYYRKFFSNIIEETLGDLQRQIHRSSKKAAIMNIHPTVKEQWYAYIDLFD